MEEPISILSDIKKSLGIGIDDPSFDDELLLHIDASFGDIDQIGAPIVAEPVTKDTTWDQKLLDVVPGTSGYALIRSYVFLNVKMLFDPPAPSTLGTYTDTSHRMLWRIQLEYSKGDPDGDTN